MRLMYESVDVELHLTVGGHCSCHLGVNQDCVSNEGGLTSLQVFRVFREVLWAGGSRAVRGLHRERDGSVQEKLWNVAGLWRETCTKRSFMLHHNATGPEDQHRIHNQLPFIFTIVRGPLKGLHTHSLKSSHSKIQNLNTGYTLFFYWDFV